jgi:hypothetical protein
VRRTWRVLPPRSRAWTLGLTVAALAIAGGAVGSFAIHGTTSTSGGIENAAAWLAHWQETGVIAATTPAPVPPLLSALPTTPSRLAVAGASYLVDAGVAGDLAIEWRFAESVGILANQEIDLAFTIQYEVGIVAHTATVTVFVETQATAPVGTLAFTLYWDAGAATGITFSSETEIAQSCPSVGTCP